ncbi:ABC transporter permease [Verticiella sediminum]|uniref:ABC transporter permease n=1 Tax=Verticiella sediminum TaxID=1247510 RepID=A0A556B0Y9_9BURK|nr:ABC transporter permease [Verticiella sediminum]TSH98856.1 ABC transporter permease [Verticiella sediminum]
MASNALCLPAATAAPERPRGRRLPRLRILLPLLWICLVALLAVGAPWLPLPSSADMDFANFESGPSAAHWLGTDLDGRDILSRAVHGAQVSLVVSLGAPAIGLVAGTPLGLLASYYDGWLRTGILALLDAMLAFPSLVFALGLTVVLGPSVQNVTLALGIMSIPAFARIARANALPLLGREFVLAARTAGASDTDILLREILPNMLMPLLTYALTMMSVMIVAEGSLSFLGVGVPPPTPSWGGMIAEGREALERVPHVSLIPAAIMFLTVLSLNLLGDALRQKHAGRAGGLA